MAPSGVNADLAYAIVTSVGEGVLAADPVGRVTFANPAAARMLGGSEIELLGRAVEDLVAPTDDGRFDSAIDLRDIPRTLRSGRWAEDGVLIRLDGSRVPVARTITPLLLGDGLVGSVATFRDISQRKALEEQLIEQAFHDELTGLANRALFLDRLAHAHARVSRRDAFYGVMFVDLDGFKSVNDTLGHAGGDGVLVAVARLIQLSARPSDTVARFGGDEFAVLLEDLSAPGDAEAVAARLLSHLEMPLEVDGVRVHLGASIGVVTSDGRSLDPKDCLRLADVAMYRAKDKGKGRFEVAPRHEPETPPVTRPFPC